MDKNKDYSKVDNYMKTETIVIRGHHLRNLVGCFRGDPDHTIRFNRLICNLPDDAKIKIVAHPDDFCHDECYASQNDCKDKKPESQLSFHPRDAEIAKQLLGIHLTQERPEIEISALKLKKKLKEYGGDVFGKIVNF